MPRESLTHCSECGRRLRAVRKVDRSTFAFWLNHATDCARRTFGAPDITAAQAKEAKR